MNAASTQSAETVAPSFRGMQPSVGWVRTGIGLAVIGYTLVTVAVLFTFAQNRLLVVQESVTTALLILFFLTCRKSPVGSSIGTIAVILLETSISMWDAGTVACVSVVAYPLIVFTAGLLLGGRGAITLGIISGMVIPLSVYLSGAWGWTFGHFDFSGDGYWMIVVELSIFVTAFLTREAVDTYYSAWLELSRSRKRYAELFQASPDPLVALSGGRVLVDLNTAASRLFPGGPLQGHTISELWAKAGGVGDMDARIQEAETPVAVELRDPNGKTTYFELTRYLHSGPGFDTLVMLRDVTERRLLEERLGHAQKLELVGRLAGGVAHDFNNLLTVVGGNAMQLRAHADPQVQQVGEAILEAQQRGAGLTRQLLAFARKDIFKPVPVDMAAMVFGMRRLLERVLGEQHRLEVDVEEDLWVVADVAQLEQVLLNLVCNARDAMPTGGRVLVRVRRQEEPEAAKRGSRLKLGAQVCLEVSDEGCGMSAEVLARLFEPFFTTKPRGQGTGLGLASAQGIVLRCDGQIHVESEPGKGSVFRVFLPRIEHARVQVSPTPETPAQDNPINGAGILLVEDEPGVRSLAAVILRKAGYRVTDTPDAVQGMRLLQGGLKVDLVCSDIMLPGMSGLELKEALKRSYGRLPVLLMSGYFQVDPESVLSQAEGSKILRKPFTPEELLAAVAEALRK